MVTCLVIKLCMRMTIGWNDCRTTLSTCARSRPPATVHVRGRSATRERPCTTFKCSIIESNDRTLFNLHPIKTNSTKCILHLMVEPMNRTAFILHHLCSQYAMLLDVVNNVVLHVEPERRRTLERRARMRFQLQLHQDQDPRQLIHKLQTQVRDYITQS